MKFDADTLKFVGSLVKESMANEMGPVLDEDPEMKALALECSSDLTAEYMQYIAAVNDPKVRERHLKNMQHIKQTLKHIENAKKYDAYSAIINVTGIVIAQMIKAGIKSVI